MSVDPKPPLGTRCARCGGFWHLTEHCPVDPPLAVQMRELIVIAEHDQALTPSRHEITKRFNPDEVMPPSYIGDHHWCGGCIDLKEISATHNCLVCRACKLRVTIPKTVRTFADLRVHFNELNPV